VVWTSYHYDVLGYLCFETADNAHTNPIYAHCKEINEYSNLGYFFTFYILFNNFIPISLYVTVEFCNYVQASFIDNDLNMYDSVANVPTVARTSNMNGDLGMIEYVFSDKTGTLTQNLMVFNRCSVGGVIYCVDPLDVCADAGEQDNVTAVIYEPLHKLKELASGTMHDPLDPQNSFAQFVFVLSVAHTVVIDPLTNVS
jgi:magnesium-transporting ATPase (P-type)